MRSFEGAALDFPNGKFLIGSGYQPGISAWSLTGLLQPVAEVPITYVMRQQINPGDGTSPEDGLSFVRLRGVIPVGLLPDNFIVGELGIQVPSNIPGVTGNILWGYTNADDPEVYRMRGSSLNAEVIDIFVLISDDATVNLTPDLGMVGATIFDIDEAVEKHNTAQGRHAAQFDAVKNSVAAVNNSLSAHAGSSLGHPGLASLLLPSGVPVKGNPHGLALGDIIFRDDVSVTAVGGEPPLHRARIGPFLVYWGRVRGLGQGLFNPKSKDVNFPIPFTDGNYYAAAQVWNGPETVSIKTKKPNKIEIYLESSIVANIDADFFCFGLAVQPGALPIRPAEIPVPEIPLTPLPTPEGNVYARLVSTDGTVYGNYYTDSGRLLYYRPDTQLYYDALLYPAPIALPAKDGAVIHARYEKSDRGFYTADSFGELVYYDPVGGYYYTLSGIGATGVPIAYNFTTDNNWQEDGAGQYVLQLAVGQATVEYVIVGSIVDSTGTAKAVGHSISSGIVTITADEPFNGKVTVASVAAEGEVL